MHLQFFLKQFKLTAMTMTTTTLELELEAKSCWFRAVSECDSVCVFVYAPRPRGGGIAFPTCNWNAICYGKLSLHLSVKFTLGCLPVVVDVLVLMPFPAGCRAVMALDHGTWPVDPGSRLLASRFHPVCALSLLGS